MNVGIGDHFGISPLTKKKIKKEKLRNSSVVDHLQLCDHSASSDDLNILTRKNKKILLKLESSNN